MWVTASALALAAAAVCHTVEPMVRRRVPTDDFRHKSDIASCRICGHRQLEPILDLGMMPLTAAFVPAVAHQAHLPERRYPLEMVFCPECSLVQVLETVPADQIFHSNYPYYSSYSETLLRHAAANVDQLCRRLPLNENSLVVELASNDGYLLRNFLARKIPVLGIDPAPGPAEAARQIGIPTLCRFFGDDLARDLVARGQRADLIVANNVMAHVADLNGFVAGIRRLLKDDGTLVTESPYVREMVDNCEFDTIYHEHLCYYSVTALRNLFARHGLYVNDIERLPIHGGSIRLYVGTRPQVQPAVLQILEEERHNGLTSAEYYQDFARRVANVREGLRDLLHRLKAAGHRIAAYGAAAKGVILLNYVGIEPGLIDYCCDKNEHKQGTFMPGLEIRVEPPEKLLEESPDYCLILAWNFQDEIMTQQAEYAARGGRFIVPIPEPRIVKKSGVVRRIA